MKIQKKPKLYQCPLCDEESGSVGTDDEILAHLKEDHLEQETPEDFIREVFDTILILEAYIEGLRSRR
jgi:hypothetical protein